jgi:hypothetical protein
MVTPATKWCDGGTQAVTFKVVWALAAVTGNVRAQASAVRITVLFRTLDSSSASVASYSIFARAAPAFGRLVGAAIIVGP